MRLLLIALAPVALGAQRPDSATFVTRLGSDTLVVERVVRTPRTMRAEVLLRTPRTTRSVTTLALGADGAWERMEVQQGAAVATTVVREGDSLRIDGGGRTRRVAAAALALPWFDYVHWPYELALLRVRPGSGEQAQPMLTGGSIGQFRLARPRPDSATVTHPFRGTMTVRTDAEGRILALDAGATTRKLVVERRPWMADAELAALAARWGALDSAGRSFGALSGRAQVEGRVGAATVRVDHGTPAMRGRAIWGALVPYGQVWRTGANEATHLETDRDLVLGAGSDTLVVPAGRYTLFSIPAADGGTLIVNRQVGQTGTAYDATRDLGRVRMTRRALAAPVEAFAVAVEDGRLELRWDRAALGVPVRVR